MKKTLLLKIVFLTSILFYGCASDIPRIIFYTPIIAIPAFFNSFYYKYDFVNSKNKNVTMKKIDETDEYGKWYESEIIMENVKFYFSLNEYEDEIHGKYVLVYTPLFRIIAIEDKYIDHVFINRIIIYNGKSEYNILERIEYITITIKDGTAPNIDDYWSLTKEEINNVSGTGLIEPAVYTNDKGALINVQGVSVHFYGIPKNILNKKVRILFDISVEYTTGEKIQINQEVTGLQKLRRRKLAWHEYIWFPAV